MASLVFQKHPPQNHACMEGRPASGPASGLLSSLRLGTPTLDFSDFM